MKLTEKNNHPCRILPLPKILACQNFNPCKDNHIINTISLLHNCIAGNIEYKPHKQMSLYIFKEQQLKHTDKGEKEQGQESSKSSRSCSCS
jgi:hypothetical protein